MRAEKYGIDCSRGVMNRGNLYRIERAMRKAMRGEHVTVGFLGGSITQGCLSSAQLMLRLSGVSVVVRYLSGCGGDVRQRRDRGNNVPVWRGEG